MFSEITPAFQEADGGTGGSPGARFTGSGVQHLRCNAQGRALDLQVALLLEVPGIG